MIIILSIAFIIIMLSAFSVIFDIVILYDTFGIYSIVSLVVGIALLITAFIKGDKNDR